MTTGDFALRLGMATLLAGVLGFERELRGQVAGLRTHILVSIGACLFTLVGAYGFLEESAQDAGGVRSDVTRVASQVVVGIGFLGGGAILHSGASIRGLTTAANLWVAAALGLACGAGCFSAGAITAAIALVVLSGFKPFERWIQRHRRKGRRSDDVSSPRSSEQESELGDVPH